MTKQRDPRWIVDSGASRHLVNDASVLRHVKDADIDSLTQPDGNALSVTKVGSVTFLAEVNGAATTITVDDVYYAPSLAHNLLSLGKLAKRGCALTTVNGHLAITHDKQIVFEVTFANDVLVAKLTAQRQATPDVEMLALAAISDTAPKNDVHRDTLMGLHQRFGHLGFDTVDRIARDPLSGIVITDHTRRVCVTCAEGKQTKRKQSKKDSGEHAPIDIVGGVICSDLKGPLTPRDHSGNRYLVNFVDHRSNYCRVFASKTKDEAARKFRDFLVFFEKRFSCKVHVLRTDGGGEYRTVELFCQQNGVARQVSEASDQASNGKAERMHRTIFNMVRCMIFESGLAPSFWSDAAEYATYILNRSPTRANPDRQSPLQVLTGVIPSLHDVVAFGTTCTVRRDQKKQTLKKRAAVGRIIGKDQRTKGYRVYLPTERIVLVTHHVTNLATPPTASPDRQLEIATQPSGPGPDTTENSANPEGLGLDTTENPANTATTEPILRRSTRTRRKSWKQAAADRDNVLPRLSGGMAKGGDLSGDVALVATTPTSTFGDAREFSPYPKNYHKARNGTPVNYWNAAANQELQA
ncbi:unnamed protein product [Phytophthora fragariaefolia]|uniref:Unnamed protein product n=1 Tax=Phytophthora fragariaefolia TaxID=1490495 RepID=A0A9W6WJC1_9STRA|nr:unnamed protein product [Phytophthora fragariaefolia]